MCRIWVYCRSGDKAPIAGAAGVLVTSAYISCIYGRSLIVAQMWRPLWSGLRWLLSCVVAPLCQDGGK